jgi:hypothetical protein
MKIAKTTAVKLTGKEYDLLRDAANLIGTIVEEKNSGDFENYNLDAVEQDIYAFLDDPNVYVEWE